MNNIQALRKREEEISQALLRSIDTLQTTRKAYKEASSIFTDLCEEKLRVQTALAELEGRITKVPSPSSCSSKSSASTQRKLSVKKEWDETQALLAQYGLSRKK